MSELQQSFKKAIQVFAHASDFVVPLYEDAYLIAEDISDEIAAERTLYEQDYETQQGIEIEIEGAVAFFSKLTASFFVIQLSLLEDCLLEICEAASQERNIPFDAGPTERFTAEQAIQFFKHELGAMLPDPWPVWEKIQEFLTLRDQLMKNKRLDEGSFNISDTLLVDINETFVLFFEGLQSLLIQNLDGNQAKQM